MTIMEIAKAYNLQPKDVKEYIQANATFPVKRNFQTGEISIPDDIDIESFISPLIQDIADMQQKAEEKAAQIEREKAEQAAQEEIEQAKQAALQRKRQDQTRFLQEEQEKQRTELLYAAAIEKLKAEGAEGYYQYKVVSLVDKDGGYIDADTLTSQLTVLGIEGWHLATAYTNEVGHTSHSSGFGGVSSGTNATIDQNILIFERFVKFK